MSRYPIPFGRYELLERINMGGMAEVFKAKTLGSPGFERVIAIKRILPSLAEDEEFVAMFLDEAKIAMQLNHPNIVQMYELAKHGAHYYIAMEYIPSRDLRHVFDQLKKRGARLGIAESVYIAARVGEGLDYAHRRSDAKGKPMEIVHRDVSPQNILLTNDGEVKIIDFGIAKAADRASKTQAGVLKGKFAYMSPEQVRGEPVDRRSDVFALGVLLYEMLAGERLFYSESDLMTLERVRNATIPPLREKNADVDEHLDAIVMKGLSLEPADRFAWAGEFAAALTQYAAQHNARCEALDLRESLLSNLGDEYAQLGMSMESAPVESGQTRKLEPLSINSSEIESLSGDAEDEAGRTVIIQVSEQAGFLSTQGISVPHSESAAKNQEETSATPMARPAWSSLHSDAAAISPDAGGLLPAASTQKRRKHQIALAGSVGLFLLVTLVGLLIPSTPISSRKVRVQNADPKLERVELRVDGNVVSTSIPEMIKIGAAPVLLVATTKGQESFGKIIPSDFVDEAITLPFHATKEEPILPAGDLYDAGEEPEPESPPRVVHKIIDFEIVALPGSKFSIDDGPLVTSPMSGPMRLKTGSHRIRLEWGLGTGKKKERWRFWISPKAKNASITFRLGTGKAPKATKGISINKRRR